jgi:hypothetical protein
MKQIACWTWDSLRDIERIMKVLPSKDKIWCFRQPFQKTSIGNGILHKPVQVEATENTTVEAIIQKYILVQREKNRINH